MDVSKVPMRSLIDTHNSTVLKLRDQNQDVSEDDVKEAIRCILEKTDIVVSYGGPNDDPDINDDFVVMHLKRLNFCFDDINEIFGYDFPKMLNDIFIGKNEEYMRLTEVSSEGKRQESEAISYADMRNKFKDKNVIVTDREIPAASKDITASFTYAYLDDTSPLGISFELLRSKDKSQKPRKSRASRKSET